MLLKDAQIGRTYVVQEIRLPFQLERRLEALGMTRQTPVSVLNRTERDPHHQAAGHPLCSGVQHHPKHRSKGGAAGCLNRNMI